MVAKYEPIYLLFEDAAVKWKWTESELFRFRRMWEDGADLSELTKAFKTNRRSIALVVMDQAEQGFIEQRRFGLFGK
ncbi:hypothetical protein [Sporosarcina newyorkensis]|nr:hypothetical protein [Sporosarcina newyorkensis]